MCVWVMELTVYNFAHSVCGRGKDVKKTQNNSNKQAHLEKCVALQCYKGSVSFITEAFMPIGSLPNADQITQSPIQVTKSLGYEGRCLI